MEDENQQNMEDESVTSHLANEKGIKRRIVDSTGKYVTLICVESSRGCHAPRRVVCESSEFGSDDGASRRFISRIAQLHSSSHASRRLITRDAHFLCTLRHEWLIPHGLELLGTSSSGFLFDPEIEKTARANRKAPIDMAGEENFISVPPQRRTLGDYGQRNNGGIANLAFQPVNPVTFDIKNTVINALKEDQYSGAESQCPNLHLSHFYDACDYTDPPGISESDKRLRLFKFSLTGRAKDWLDTIPPGTIATWQDLERKFKDRYFPIHKFLERRSEIMNFEQGIDRREEADWFKSNVRACVGNGENIGFWNFKWLGNNTFRELYPSLYAKEENLNVVIAERLGGSGETSLRSW
ncbi:hypothetical protein TSUD_284820 [Trifolium subterraneum]|uniref:Retrotransposon gag domain-containing protein n=1 Tax=Trifolium subterraneum TaxID=3900 RepID=A0A2Z6NQW4_TRISU|nr:hypothetical protein TSUD_284820 [Trifolium subterraneum]